MTVVTDQAAHTVGTWPSSQRLRIALRANAVFSLACGIALLAGGWWLAGPWTLGPPALPPAVGAGVAAFGLLLSRIAVEPGKSACG